MSTSPADGAQGASTAAGDAALNSQKELVDYNLKMNTAFAWLQSALDLAKKIKG